MYTSYLEAVNWQQYQHLIAVKRSFASGMNEYLVPEGLISLKGFEKQMIKMH